MDRYRTPAPNIVWSQKRTEHAAGEVASVQFLESVVSILDSMSLDSTVSILKLKCFK